MAASTPTNIKTEAYVVMERKAPFELCHITLDAIRPDELLIEMAYTGICHSDIVMQQGLLGAYNTYPSIFGHEGAGYIRAIGSSVQDKTLAIGDAVLLSFSTCGKCPECAIKHPSYCHNHSTYNLLGVRMEDGSSSASLDDGTKVNGQFFGQSSFSRMSVVKERCVVKCEYPENLDLYAPMGCGFQTGAGTVLNTLKPGKDNPLIIFGMGTVGLSALMAAKYLSVGMIIAVDIVEEKLELAKELGATVCVNTLGETDVQRKLLEVAGKRGIDFAIDATGIVKVVEDMVEVLGHCGTAALVGMMPMGSKLSFDPTKFLMGNKRLIGIIEGDSYPPEFIPQMIRLHRKGVFPIEKLCRTYPAENIKEAVHDMHVGTVVKPVLKW